jgi:hypothetical protein
MLGGLLRDARRGRNRATAIAERIDDSHARKPLRSMVERQSMTVMPRPRQRVRLGVGRRGRADKPKHAQRRRSIDPAKICHLHAREVEFGRLARASCSR